MPRNVAASPFNCLTSPKQVDAYPPVVTFSWFFNSSEHRLEQLEESRFSSEGLVSALDFAPTSEQVSQWKVYISKKPLL